MSELRCRPGDLAIVIQAQFPTNMGRIVRIIGVDDRKGDLLFPVQTPTWEVRCELPMTWRSNNKRFRRKQGPVPDACLQPIRGNFIGKDIADGLISLGVISAQLTSANASENSVAVASIALEHGANEDQIIAVLLHDAIEYNEKLYF
jgi:hypothetical protein